MYKDTLSLLVYGSLFHSKFDIPDNYTSCSFNVFCYASLIYFNYIFLKMQRVLTSNYQFWNFSAMMAVFMPINAAFQIALLNDIVAEHAELRSGVRFRIMDDTICKELRVSSISTDTHMKYYGSKSFTSSSESSRYLPTGKCMPTCCKDFWRHLFSPTPETSSLALLFTGYIAYDARVGFGWSGFRS